ncbi:hypothetical protein NLI96_g9454 [Meripilus lineatus]|uniref:DNA-binding protein n=1 Tax=Meripilus lineatus TaxID=2056292 RepID=A0AAD5V0N1_9APHY|nr:hypothetical protein NLI96_g9454 [Physisporinus lineatus]
MALSNKEIIEKFNEQVNMSAEEIEEWLKNPESKKAGTGVGIESGRKIIEILRRNPEKDPGSYNEEDLEHMRKVVGYNSRHLAQEGHLKDTKTTEELEHTKSTISLKNWGHDPLKTLDKAEDKSDTEPAEVEASPSKDLEEPTTKKSSEPNGEQESPGKKRKLEERETPEEGEVDLDEDSITPNEEENHEEEDDHARKKSKTNGEIAEETSG